MSVHVGKYFLFPRGDTIVQVTAVADEPDPLISSDRHLMEFIDLRTEQEHGAHFVQEIGTEFFPIPPGFPKEKIDAYVQASNARDDANDIMHEIHMELIELGVEG